ncbi:MAG: DUF11 domain-containing protein, partial [Planctomycetia bacterium]|nr:DUF11 domain-containing protein [Planctomycetia bacterium]
MTAPDSDPAAAAARNGTGSKLNNNDFRMAYVDIDGDNTTFNSSSASLVLPAGADVLFAGLYWGARVNSSFPTGKLSEINNVKFRGPTDGTTYTPLAGTTIGTTTAGAPDSGVSTYQSFKDVTAIVQTEGAGVYTMANVQAIKDSADYCAGWALVVVYHSAADPLRNLTVFDGFGSVINSDTITFPISGFTAPPSGPVEAAIGFVSYEGDLGFTGDNAYIDGGAGFQQLSNTTNPADNFFNSTITNRNTYVTTKTPNYQNQLGFDADIFATTNVITNGATSATVKMSTNGDYYYPGVVTSCIDLYAPKITVQKAVADVNGGIVQPGDVLRYTITVANDANAYDTAANVILNDLIPAYTTYKPNTLFITAGANSSAAVKTDPVDFDQAEFLSGAVRFQLGTGAGGGGPPPVGGTLKKGEFTTVTFDVTVNSGFPSEALIKNTAVVSFTSQFTGQPFTATASAEIKCPPVADLAIVKTDPSGTYVPGQDLTYTLTVTNNGPAAVTGAVVSDELPVGTTLVDAHGGSYNPVTRTVTYTTGSLAAGGVQAFLLTVLPASSLTGDLTNTATVVAPAGTYDPDKTNNTSTDKTTCKPQANLAIKKTANPTTVTAGGSGYTYQITVTNTGPSDAQTVSVVDTLPAGFTATAYDQ